MTNVTNLIVVACLAVPSAVAAQQPPPLQRDLPVVVTAGEAVIQAAPDRAWITVAAESRAATPQEAQRRNAAAMTPALDRLRAGGIPAEAIKTAAYSLEPDWNYSDKGRELRGYIARNTVIVRVDTIDRVGALLDMVISAGATAVDNIRFDIKDRTRLEREALRLAVADARARADAAAAGGGTTVERILRIDEQGVSSPPVVMRENLQVQRLAAAQAPPIQAGELEIRAHVTVTSLLK